MTAQILKMKTPENPLGEPETISPLMEHISAPRYNLLGREFVTRSEIWNYLRPAIKSAMKRQHEEAAKDLGELTGYEALALYMVERIFEDFLKTGCKIPNPADGKYMLQLMPSSRDAVTEIDWDADETYLIAHVRSDGEEMTTWIINVIDNLEPGYYLTFRENFSL